MTTIFDSHCIEGLLDKIESQTNTETEHHYLQKVITAHILLKPFCAKKSQSQEELLLPKYYVDRYSKWLDNHWNNELLSKKTKMDLFLLKNIIQGFCPRDQILTIAKICSQALSFEKSSLLSFFSSFLNCVYGISETTIQTILELLEYPWKASLPPLGTSIHSTMPLEAIDNYFFGAKKKTPYRFQPICDLDRYFSIGGGGEFDSYIFAPGMTSYDIFESSLLIHEMQHVQDDLAPHAKDLSPYQFEKNSLQSEKIFLQGMGSGKRGRYFWLESNLFYPIVLLKHEIQTLLYGEHNSMTFHELCLKYKLEPIPVSSLLLAGAPFQMSLYAAAVLELEPQWKKFFIFT